MAPTQTISIHVERVPDTSVLVRFRGTMKPRSGATTMPFGRKQAQGRRRKMVACEPVVSVLTEIAKQLQPGRCVT